MLKLTRSQVLAYRAQINGLETKKSTAVLETGVQDTPPGTTAHLALDTRGLTAAGLTLVHSIRGSMHVHRVDDLGLLAAALRLRSADEAVRTTHGPFFTDLSPDDLAAAWDALTRAMRSAHKGGKALTKGELSGAVTPAVDARLAPWCDGCGVHHVHDGLFRMATLQAGLRLTPDGSAFLPPAKLPRVDPDTARQTLVRRYLTVCGPAGPAHLAQWAGLTPAAAKRWFALLAGELTEVRVEGRPAWTPDPDAVAAAPAPEAVRLLPPYDPLTELADRELVAPDPARRKQIWRAVANPGVAIAAGEFVGTWRRKTVRRRTSIQITTFAPPPRALRTALGAAAEDLAAALGAEATDVTFNG
jgi:hypothetical protein